MWDGLSRICDFVCWRITRWNVIMCFFVVFVQDIASIIVIWPPQAASNVFSIMYSVSMYLAKVKYSCETNTQRLWLDHFGWGRGQMDFYLAIFMRFQILYYFNLVFSSFCEITMIAKQVYWWSLFSKITSLAPLYSAYSMLLKSCCYIGHFTSDFDQFWQNLVTWYIFCMQKYWRLSLLFAYTKTILLLTYFYCKLKVMIAKSHILVLMIDLVMMHKLLYVKYFLSLLM